MDDLPDTAVMIDGRVIDIAPLLPLKMGSWKILRKQHGVDPVAIGQKINRGTGEMSGEILEALVYFTLKKADPSLTDQLIDDNLELPAMIRLGGAIMSYEAKKTSEGPTLTSSLSLPNGGGGVQAISTS